MPDTFARLTKWLTIPVMIAGTVGAVAAGAAFFGIDVVTHADTLEQMAQAQQAIHEQQTRVTQSILDQLKDINQEVTALNTRSDLSLRVACGNTERHILAQHGLLAECRRMGYD